MVNTAPPPKEVAGIREAAVNQQVWRVPVQQRGIFNVTQDFVRGDKLDPSIGLPNPAMIWLDK